MLIISVVVFLWPGSIEQIAAGLVIIGLSMGLYTRAAPFADRQVDSLASISLTAQAVTLFYGLMVEVRKTRNLVEGSVEDTAMRFIVLALNIMLLILPVVAGVYHIWKASHISHRREKTFGFLEGILQIGVSSHDAGILRSCSATSKLDQPTVKGSQGPSSFKWEETQNVSQPFFESASLPRSVKESREQASSEINDATDLDSAGHLNGSGPDSTEALKEIRGQATSEAVSSTSSSALQEAAGPPALPDNQFDVSRVADELDPGPVIIEMAGERNPPNWQGDKPSGSTPRGSTGSGEGGSPHHPRNNPCESRDNPDFSVAEAERQAIDESLSKQWV
mmetsp:Transcript_328/g.604  ORF Transcript_328/g.604 Transcript_328/m.604 type:complete len:336 (-) Transcript_328:220-1227(-)